MRDRIREERDAELKQLRELTVDKWLEYIRRIVGENLRGTDSSVHDDSYLGEMLSPSDDRWFGYGGPDPMVAIRLAIDAFPDAERFIYDLTDLIQQEYLDIDEDPIERHIDWAVADLHVRSRVIVIPEGPTDVEILKPSLELLYPHLAGYFSFMNFAESGGGARALANFVRALVGAGIVNRVIAIFDNDAAGTVASRELRRSSLPKNIIVLQLPDLASLQAYPTVGPTGPSPMNINGMAASIELYLGDDVLRETSGELPHVQWTNYERSLARYQGELLGKQRVQDRFKQKLVRAAGDAGFHQSADWTGLRAIFAVLFSAFHPVDADILSAQLLFFYRQQ